MLDPAANRDWPEFTPEQIGVIQGADIVLLQREIPESINIKAAQYASKENVSFFSSFNKIGLRF